MEVQEGFEQVEQHAHADSQIVQIQNAAEQYAAQFAALYSAHRDTFVLRNPAPTPIPYESIVPMPEKPMLAKESQLPRFLLLALIVSALIVAGSRTIGEFGRGIPDQNVGLFVGIAGFVMANVAVIVYAFIRTSTNYNEERHASVQRLINTGMWVAFSVDLFANLHAALKTNGFQNPIIDLVFTIALAVSAPILAFIAGDAFGLYVVRDRSRQQKADAVHHDALLKWNDERKAHERDHQERLQTWREELDQSWNAEKGRMGLSVRIIERPKLPTGRTGGQVSVLSDRTDNGQTTEGVRPSAYGHNRTADGQVRVMEYLTQHPDDAALPARKLADKMLEVSGVKVGHDTANKGRNAWRSMNRNGTHRE